MNPRDLPHTTHTTTHSLSPLQRIPSPCSLRTANPVPWARYFCAIHLGADCAAATNSAGERAACFFFWSVSNMTSEDFVQINCQLSQ